MALQATFTNKMQSLDEERDKFKVTYHQRRDKEDELFKLITEEETNYELINEFFENNDASRLDPQLVSVSKKVSMKLYIDVMIEKMKEALEQFDAVELKSLYDEVCGKNIILEQSLVDSIEDMLYDAEGNENYQADKLAEVKKGGKPQKKKK